VPARDDTLHGVNSDREGTVFNKLRSQVQLDT
jgi:hypothetical protein